jgi:hypothetical protein
MLGEQPIDDHRYLLSSAAVMFGRADFKAASGRCWEETFWLLGPDAVDRFARLPEDARPAGSAAFPDGGFYVLRSPYAHVIVDCGDVGMKGRGGHGHNDILSFELFMNGFNVVTDCGAFLYTASREWRNRFRSTAFHNTVQIDGEELNRFISPDALWQLGSGRAWPVSPGRHRSIPRRTQGIRTAGSARQAHERVLRGGGHAPCAGARCPGRSRIACGCVALSPGPGRLGGSVRRGRVSSSSRSLGVADARVPSS